MVDGSVSATVILTESDAATSEVGAMLTVEVPLLAPVGMVIVPVASSVGMVTLLVSDEVTV